MIDRQSLIDAYLEACETELQAFKPGNVSIYSEAHDMTVEDFRVSARVSASAITDPNYTLGEKIYYAVKATRETVACNTNLGIILLCAPLMQAVQLYSKDSDFSVRPSTGLSTNGLAGEAVSESCLWLNSKGLRRGLALVLQSTTEQDADWVFKAIVLAAPGGLGASESQDVREKASVTLTQAMEIAAERDRIALQYTNCFKDIFDFTVLEYNRAFVWSGDKGWAALAVYAQLLARFPDSHVERKYGKQYSAWIAGEMVLLCNAIDAANKPEEVLPMLQHIDEVFKAKKINPGTSADMTVATVLVVLLEQLFSQGDD